MKKVISILLMIAMTVTFFTACSKDIPDVETDEQNRESVTDMPDESDTSEAEKTDAPEITEPVYMETEVGTENTLSSIGETISMNVAENVLYITNLATASNAENKLVENSAFQLPQFIETEKEKITLNWEYVSAMKYENREVNGSLTSGLVYRFKEAAQNLALRVCFVVRPELSGPFEIYMEVDNLNDTETRIALDGGFTSFSTKVLDADTTNIVRIKSEGFIAEGHVQNADALKNENYNDGVMYEGTGIYIDNLSSGMTLVSSDRPDFQSNGTFYMAQFIDRNSVDGVFIALNWTTGKLWSTVENDDYIVTKASLENTEGEFSTLIQPGDTFVIPSVYILPYEGDIDDCSNVFKSWFFDCKAVSVLREDESLPYIQIDDQMSPEDAKDLGIDSIKWDYGWYTNYGFTAEVPLPYESAWTLLAEGQDAPGCAQWTLSTNGKYLDSLGLNFTTYLLLHENLDTDGNPTDKFGELNAVTHPEWFSNQKHPFCRLADLGNVECVEYLKTTLEKFFKNNHVDQWRSDFEPIAVYSDQKNRHDANGSDVSYWCTVGFYEMITHLYDTVDGFQYENCSSGGGNKDLFNAEFSTVINCDDTANYLSLRTSFYDSSYIIHPSQLQLPCNIDTFNPNYGKIYYFPDISEPEVAEGDTYDFIDAMRDMGFRSTIIGVPMWSSWSGKGSVVLAHDYYKEYSTIYKEKVRPLVREAELYHILPRPDGTNWDGIMYANPDSENEIKGVVFLFKPSAEVSDMYHVVFEGLYEDTVYQLTFEDRPEQNCTAMGAELMTKGIDVEIKYVGSEMIWISEVNNG